MRGGHINNKSRNTACHVSLMKPRGTVPEAGADVMQSGSCAALNPSPTVCKTERWHRPSPPRGGGC